MQTMKGFDGEEMKEFVLLIIFQKYMIHVTMLV
jgi:hypothetical protein